MIISASRRTDIPAHYAPWFFNRLRDGFVCVRNPMNPRQVSRVSLARDVLDGIVFWTKNPAPMLDRLDELGSVPFYFQITLTGYDRDAEACLPDKESVILPSIRRLAEKIGSERIIWRYDPILINARYSLIWHAAQFDRLAERLSGCAQSCVISFIDDYRCSAGSMKPLALLSFPPEDQRRLAEKIVRTADRFHFRVNTCAESIDLSEWGIGHSRCVDDALLSRIGGRPLRAGRETSLRRHCGCVRSIDIGQYDTCPNGCRYCYATHSLKALERNRRLHDPDSPLLVGHIEKDDVVSQRAVSSCAVRQTSFLE